MASLNRDAAANAVLPGDLLRALTCTTFVYPTRSLFGLVPPERHVVLYGADKMKFAEVSVALRRGEARDGEVTVVVERSRAEGA